MCYGYWVARDEIYEVPFEGHFETAVEILHDLGLVDASKIDHRAVYYRYDLDFNDEIYCTMFRLGFVRVVNEADGCTSVEYSADAQLSKLQKEFVKNADYVEIIDADTREVIG